MIEKFEKEKTEGTSEVDTRSESEAEQKLSLFRDEIEKRHRAEIKIAEEAKQTGEKTGEAIHFADPSFNVAELTEEDMVIWEKIKDESLTWEEYEEYRSKLLAAGILTREEMKMSSRAHFYDAVGNRANRILVRKPRGHAHN